MKDSYGDGMCCSYGSGSYSLDDSSGNLASGGSFGSSETTNFCVGGGTPAEICDDGVDIDRDTLVDCANTEDCASAPNCQPADWTELGNDDFEGGWGTWNDGGSDARRSARDSAFAPQGTYSARLRDNTSTSVITSDALDLSSYSDLEIAFSHRLESMDNANEDFWVQYSDDGDATWQTVATYALNDPFQNGVTYRDNTVLLRSGQYNFTSNAKLRFRCDASGNSDWVYIDEIVVSAK